MKNNLNKIFFFLAVLFIPLLSLSQSFQWIQNGGGNNTISGSLYYQREQVIDMATDSQRNVYVISPLPRESFRVVLNKSKTTKNPVK